MKTNARIQQLVTDWTTNPRWKGIERPYSAEKVVKLQGSCWFRSFNRKPSDSRSRCRFGSYLFKRLASSC
jgi:isocitrate lyase